MSSNFAHFSPYAGTIGAYPGQAGSNRTIEARAGRAKGSLAMLQERGGIGAAVVEVARPEYRLFGALLIVGFGGSEETRLPPRSLRNVTPVLGGRWRRRAAR